MAVIRDMMPAFELFQPTSVEAAVSLLGEHGDDAWVLAGGLDSLEWFKDRVKKPRVVVDINGIENLRSIEVTENGLEIGAMATLNQVAKHETVKSNYSILAKAAGLVATPQIRNQGTIGGNVAQDTRCWYYRSGWPCYRAGGNVCYASSPTAMNREHCVLGASRCVAVNPSDTAPALITLGAQFVINGPRGERVIEAEEFFMKPSVDITKMNVMGDGDLLTSIRLPAEWSGARYYFEKVRDRGSWDFALVNVASAMRMDGANIGSARVVVNGVAPYPVRLREVESWITGKPANENTAHEAGEIAVRRVRPLRHNDYKVPLLRNLVKRSIRGEEA
ncbi:MAG: xanthine dehydrogenase family protein subunit M [Gemmatimonadota bacterium]|nr:xanthine dehydrogenase family protein subunit M [Gemmatimonadota bacterium]MDH5804793.1 xanthine dehydrogenase family protein subunit M [Gemmatimonadota bacterium]